MASEMTTGWAMLVALGASMTILGTGGERVVSAEDFFVGVYETDVHEGLQLAGDHRHGLEEPAAPRLHRPAGPRQPVLVQEHQAASAIVSAFTH